MRIGRTLPPAASPVPLSDILRAMPACFQPDHYNQFFEQEVKEYFDSKYCFFVSSGKAALTIILQSLRKINPQATQIVLPAFTCYSVAAAAKRAGLQIRLCDLAPDALDLDLCQLKKIIRADKKKKILCVLATHLFGCPANVAAIRSILDRDIPIIEDAAQAMGETDRHKQLGTLGEAGFFSLGRGKALSTMEGGIILTNQDDVAKQIVSIMDTLPDYRVTDALKLACKTILTTILQLPSLFWLPLALPFLRLGETLYEPDFPIRKLSSYHMKLARNWQERLGRHRSARLKNIAYWQKVLPAPMLSLCRETKCSLVRLPVIIPNIEERSRVLRQSKRWGLGIMPAYPTPINKIPDLEKDFSGQEYPIAEDICNRLLTIPVHEYVGQVDNEHILSIFKCNSI